MKHKRPQIPVHHFDKIELVDGTIVVTVDDHDHEFANRYLALLEGRSESYERKKEEMS